MDLALVRQLDLACKARDLPAARRIVRAMCETERGQPTDIAREQAVLRTYAVEIHGWEIA